MDTITIELRHANAKKLLKELEDMDIIKVIERHEGGNNKIKPSELRGFLSKQKATAILAHVQESRNEWPGRLPHK